MPATLGSVTTSVFEHTPEAHKLHMEFTVAAGQSVQKGDLVVLATNGRVQAAASAAPAYSILGVAIMDGAAGEFVTIAMRAFAVVNGEAAAINFNAGAAQLGAWNATTGKREYAAADPTSTATLTAATIGHNLTQATADGEAVQIALLP